MEDNEKITKLMENQDSFRKVVDERLERNINNTKEIETKVTALDEKIARVNKIAEDSASTLSEVRNELSELGKVSKQTEGQERNQLNEYVGHVALALAGNRDSMKRIQAANTENTNSTGGALVPAQFVPELIKLVAQYGVFRGYARQVPMASDTATWPKLEGDVTIYSPGEAGTITASNPTFSNVSIQPKKLVALTAVSSELEEDAALAIGAIVTDSMARKFAQTEDECGFLGNGSSTYFGFVGLQGAFDALAAANTTDATAYGGMVNATGHLLSDMTIADLRMLIGALPSRYERSAALYCSKRFFYNTLLPIVELATNAGGTQTTYFENGMARYLYGFPIRFVEVMPYATAVSTSFLHFGDLSMGAYLGNRRGFQIDRSNDVYFTSDQIGIRATERIGLNVFGIGSSTVAGPICTLRTAAD